MFTQKLVPLVSRELAHQVSTNRIEALSTETKHTEKQGNTTLISLHFLLINVLTLILTATWVLSIDLFLRPTNDYIK